MVFTPFTPQTAPSVALTYSPAGLTGAVAASRWAGATTGGAPVTGTFLTGDFVIDQTGSVWICTAGGSPGTWVNATSGRLLAVPSVYAPAGQTIKGVSAATMAAVFSTSINTGSFVAPASGAVLVTVNCMAGSASGTFVAFGLAAHNTVTPIIGQEQVFEFSTSDIVPLTLQFYVSGLTPGTTYNFDLLAAASTGAINVYANNQNSTTPTLSGLGVGGPCVITTIAQ